MLTDDEQLTYLMLVIDHSGIKLGDVPMAAGRTHTACKRMIERTRVQLKDDMEKMTSGEPLAAKTRNVSPRKKAAEKEGGPAGSPRKRRGKAAESDGGSPPKRPKKSPVKNEPETEEQAPVDEDNVAFKQEELEEEVNAAA